MSEPDRRRHERRQTPPFDPDPAGDGIVIAPESTIVSPTGTDARQSAEGVVQRPGLELRRRYLPRGAPRRYGRT